MPAGNNGKTNQPRLNGQKQEEVYMAGKDSGEETRLSRKKKRQRQIRRRVFFFCAVLAGIVLYLIFGPSRKHMDAKTYFEKMMSDGGEPVTLSEDELAVVLQDKVAAQKARVVDGRIYLDYEMVRSQILSRFYLDEENRQILYTTAFETYEIPFNSKEYARTSSDGSETLQYEEPILISDERGRYLSASFMQQYVNAECTQGEDGFHVLVEYKWGDRVTAELKRAAKVRVRSGLRGQIISEASKGDTVTVLETSGRWTHVVTANGFIGYLPSGSLTEPETVQVTREFEEAVYPARMLEEPVNLVWHMIDNTDMNSFLEQDTENMTGVNVISPTWFSLTDNEGSISSLADRKYVRKAHKMGLQVWGLVSNFQPGLSTTTVVSTTAARRRLEENLIAEALKCGMDGINVDLEAITADGARGYVQFMRELSVLCRENELVLSVDIPVPFDFNLYYDRKELGTVADYVIVMGYDEHYYGSEAGSVASLSFEENGIKRTLNSVPKEKLVSGIPFYTRIWYSKTDENGETKEWSETRGMNGAARAIEEAGAQIVWNEETMQNYAEWVTEDGTWCRVWIEDETSLEKKAALAGTYELGGLAAWVLTFQRDTVWDILSKALGMETSQ